MMMRAKLCCAVFGFLGIASAIPVSAQIGEWVDKLTGGGKPEAEKRTIAYFAVKGPLVETPTEMPPLFGDKPPLSMKALLERLKQARQDKTVAAVVLDLQDAELGLAQIEELHDSLRKFEAVDKAVHIHADSLTTGTYAAASAGRISLVPTGDLWLTGFYGESPYLRGMFDNMGVVPDFEQCGNFKTAGEMFVRKEPSPESRQMTRWLLDGLFDGMVERVATARKIPPAKLRSLIDGGPYSSEDALAAGLVDSVMYRQDFIKDLKARYGESAEIDPDYGEESGDEIPEDFFAMVSWLMEMLNPQPKVYTEPSVAIVYVEGMIQSGSAQVSPFGSAAGAFSTTIRKALDEAAQEDSVKAVVLRIDSPGGSALASEIIWDATRRVAAKKPLIVSMGNVAGSGGYYVACSAHAIFASANTITGSIGVIAGKLVTTGGWDKLGIHWHSEKRGANSGILSSATTFSDQERVKMRGYMETIYGVFKTHVVEGRGKKLSKPIDEIAGGRVYTGAQALENGLVDKLGGLDDAVKDAASRAGVSEYEIRVIPEPPSFFQLFMPKDDDEFARTAVLSQALHASMEKLLVGQAMQWLSGLDPVRIQAVTGALRAAAMVHEERVIAWMPDGFRIR